MQVLPNIYLIGPMGSGKTAVGKQLAKLLKVPFHDSDAEIEKTAGVDIPYIFDKEGEDSFRKRECDAIDHLTQLQGIVMATGGGAILAEANRLHLQNRGKVVYLHTSIEQQLERTRHSRHRPMLNVADPEQRLRSLFALRAPLYESIATIIVNTDHRRVVAVAQDIVDNLQLNNGYQLDATSHEYQ